MPETTKPLLDDPKVLIDMMDNAEGQISLVSKAVADQREIAADVSLSLEERLEAYEDIIDSEVGDTNMTRARNIERIFGFRQLFGEFGKIVT